MQTAHPSPLFSQSLLLSLGIVVWKKILNVRIHPYTKPFLTVHRPSLKHRGIPQMNISLLKAFFRTMLLTVLISPSLLSAARLANQQPPQYFYYTHWAWLTDLVVKLLMNGVEDRTIFRWWTALITHRSLEQGHLLWEAHQHLPLWWTRSTCRLTRWGAAWIEEYQTHPRNNAAVL